MLTKQEHAPARLIALVAGVMPGDYLLGLDSCTLGRSPLCHVVVRHALVSRRHAKIERCADMYILTDIGSANGTFVNGKQLVEPRQLLNGDTIGLGGTMAMIQFFISSTTEPHIKI